MSQNSEILSLDIKKIRKIIYDFSMLFSKHFYSGRFRIDDPNIIVEIYESKFCKRKYNREVFVGGVWVFSEFDRSSRQISLYAIEKINAESLNSVITSSIKCDSHIYSDMLRGYLKLRDLGYKQSTIN
ncbi:hypothetical protein DMUE_2248 [Dictyocoela muelleri]|nr:hypothetical protein DMUE_2248 [Dictyocoela muelleri]